jgi:hypothetical protein
MQKRAILAIFAVSIASFVGAAQADEYFGEVYGGGGGYPFVQICNKGSMSGMHGRYGQNIDAVGTKCYKDSPVLGTLRGGSGGSAFWSDCPGSTPFVKGIQGRYGQRVDRLGLRCTDAAKLGWGVSIQEFGGGGGSYFGYSCGNGFSVKGLFGSAGSRVDRIGVVCSNRAETSTGD